MSLTLISLLIEYQSTLQCRFYIYEHTHIRIRTLIHFTWDCFQMSYPGKRWIPHIFIHILLYSVQALRFCFFFVFLYAYSMHTNIFSDTLAHTHVCLCIFNWTQLKGMRFHMVRCEMRDAIHTHIPNVYNKLLMKSRAFAFEISRPFIYAYKAGCTWWWCLSITSNRCERRLIFFHIQICIAIGNSVLAISSQINSTV